MAWLLRLVLKLRLYRGGLLEMDMMSMAVLSIDHLLAALGLNEAERSAWYRDRVASKSASGQEYRRRKATLHRLLGDPEQVRNQPGGDALARVLAARRDELAPMSCRLDSLEKGGELSQPKNTLLRSYVHLHCNRLLAGDGLAEDQVVELVARTRNGLEHAPLVPG